MLNYNRKAGRLLAAWFFAVVHLCSAVAEEEAKDSDYYAELSSMDAATRVTLNGFVIMESDGTKNVSRVVTSYLQDGTNRVAMSFKSDSRMSLNSKSSVKVVSTPAGKRPSESTTAVIFDRSYKNRALDLYDLVTEEKAVLLSGTLNTNKHKIVFAPEKDRMTWSCRLKAPMSFERIPTRLAYTGADSSAMRDVQIHLFSSKSAEAVVFGDYSITNLAGTITLDKTIAPAAASGTKSAQHFDSILISCKLATREVTLHSLETQELAGEIVDTADFVCTGLPMFCWTRGRQMAMVSDEARRQIWQEVVKVHTAMKTSDIVTIKHLLQAKAADMIRVTHQTPEALAKDQETLFAKVWAVQGCTVQPVSEQDFRCTLINSRVIKAERANGKPLIDVYGIGGKSAEMRSVFTMPLFYAQIDGNWVIVQ